jgi:hypothetical protein
MVDNKYKVGAIIMSVDKKFEGLLVEELWGWDSIVFDILWDDGYISKNVKLSDTNVLRYLTDTEILAWRLKYE